MKNKLLLVLIPTGAWAGFMFAAYRNDWLKALSTGFTQFFNEFTFIYMMAGVLAAWSGAVLFRRPFVAAAHRIQTWSRSVTLFDLLVCLCGALIGLLFTQVWPRFIESATTLSFAVEGLLQSCIAVSTGVLFYRKRDELRYFFKQIGQRAGAGNKSGPESPTSECKILDTSVIIDGRIADLCKTGFVEGKLVIPEFVLDELQHIADSADLLKRNRGRRGLDILNKMQKELALPVTIYEGRFSEGNEVDSRLVKLAKQLGGKVVTNDFNLNKVCELQGVGVLNINDLANAIKPVVLPGEEMTVTIIKDGKEHLQGIGYLDDGTMIVVEGGKDFIGASLNVIVTSVLQTSAGRMIFARLKLLEKAL